MMLTRYRPRSTLPAFDAAERRAESCERPTVEAAAATMRVMTMMFFMCALLVEIRTSVSASRM
jgi:hypothetical protein